VTHKVAGNFLRVFRKYANLCVAHVIANIEFGKKEKMC